MCKAPSFFSLSLCLIGSKTYYYDYYYDREDYLVGVGILCCIMCYIKV